MLTCSRSVGGKKTPPLTGVEAYSNKDLRFHLNALGEQKFSKGDESALHRLVNEDIDIDIRIPKSGDEQRRKYFGGFVLGCIEADFCK